MTYRTFQLKKHDVFTVYWCDEKYLLGMPIIIKKVWYMRKLFHPYTWFRKCYIIEFVGGYGEMPIIDCVVKTEEKQ